MRGLCAEDGKTEEFLDHAEKKRHHRRLGLESEFSSSLLAGSSWKSLSFGANGIYLDNHLSKNGNDELTCANRFTHEGMPCPQSSCNEKNEMNN